MKQVRFATCFKDCARTYFTIELVGIVNPNKIVQGKEGKIMVLKKQNEHIKYKYFHFNRMKVEK